MNIAAFVYLFYAFFITQSSMKPWEDRDISVLNFLNGRLMKYQRENMKPVKMDRQENLVNRNNDIDLNEEKERVNRNPLASTEIIWSSEGSHNEYNGNIREDKRH